MIYEFFFSFFILNKIHGYSDVNVYYNWIVNGNYAQLKRVRVQYCDCNFQ